MAKVIDIEGIGPVIAGKLQAAGINTTDELLERGATPAGREAIAAQTGWSTKQVLEWVNRADLMRVRGVGSEFSDLLEQAGVDTVPELAQRKPDNLAAKLAEVNEAKKLTRRTPSAAEVEKWVAHAKELGRAIHY